MKGLATETVIIGARGYSFEITEEAITRYGVKDSETSPGILVKKHFDEIYRVLYCECQAVF